MRPRLLVSAAALLVIACGPPRIRLEWSRPAQFVMPVEQPVAIDVVPDGTPPDVNTVFGAIDAVSRGQVLNKWVAVPTVLGEMHAQLSRAGHKVVDAPAAEVIVKVKPTSWSYGNNGGRLDALVWVVSAKDPNGQALYQDTYWATGGGGRVGEPEALARASHQMALAFLRTLQPQRVSARVELDDSDPATETGVELCKDGQFEAAYQAFSDGVTKHPDSAPLLYDLAVLAEARGDYDLAESMLGRATSIAQKKIYYSALERVRNARADAEAMKSTTGP